MKTTRDNKSQFCITRAASLSSMLALILVLPLASGCKSLSKDAVLSDPQISALHDKMSKEEAVAVIQHRIQPNLNILDGNYDGTSVGPSGFVIHRSIKYGVGGRIAYGRYYPANVRTIALPDITIPFADVKAITCEREGGIFRSSLGTYYLSERGPAHGGYHGKFCRFYPERKDRKEFLAAVFLLCPNIQIRNFSLPVSYFLFNEAEPRHPRHSD